MTHEKVKLELPDGTVVDAIAPVILSASRSTDIPAFHTVGKLGIQYGLTPIQEIPNSFPTKMSKELFSGRRTRQRK